MPDATFTSPDLTTFTCLDLRTLADVEFATAGRVDWYNNDRLHSSNGYVPPAEHENTHYAAPTPEVSHS